MDKDGNAAAADVRAPQRRQGGRPTRAAALARDDRVMGVATALFLERGFAETTLEEIARRAGVAKRTIYNLYKDKSQIFAAVVRAQANAAVGRRLRSGRKSSDLDEALFGLATEVADLVTAPETTELNRLMVAEVQRFPQLVREITAIGLLELHAAVARAFESLAARGVMKLEASAWPVAVRFCDMMTGLSALHGALGVKWTTPDRDELRWRAGLFANLYRPDAGAVVHAEDPSAERTAAAKVARA